MLAITNGEVGTDGEGATGSMARVLVSATSSEMACVQEGEGEGHDRETSDDTAAARRMNLIMTSASSNTLATKEEGGHDSEI